jgi:hypothetical protein
MRLFQRALLFLEMHAAIILLIAGVVIGPYFLITLPGAGVVGSLSLLLAGMAIAALLMGRRTGRLMTPFQDLADRLGLKGVLLMGILLQVLVALATQPVPNSDGQVYLSLAGKLAAGLDYQDMDGHRAFWPPGLPLFLAPFLMVIGHVMASVIIANLILYCLGAYGVWLLGRVLFNEKAAALGALLFTLWPSRLLLAGLASKENLTIAATLLGLALFASAMTRHTWTTALLLASAAGIAFGAASLAQPGLLLFVLSLALCFRTFAAQNLLRFLACCALALICAQAALAPWQARNCAIFDKAFCGVATNGGSVFYRANNPLATGEWTPEGKIPITHLPELEQNKLGFELGKQWIAEHPVNFLELGVKKLALLMRDDRFGAYWSILRGTGLRHTDALQQVSPERMLTFRVLNAVSWVFWAVILAISARYLIERRRAPDAAQLLPLLYPLLYAMAVFFVFESDRRQHMIAMALLILLASASIGNMRHRAGQRLDKGEGKEGRAAAAAVARSAAA